MRLRLDVVSIAGGTLLLPLLSGCLFGPDSADRRSLSFDSLRFESPIAAHADSAAIEVGYGIGPNRCWETESVDLERNGGTIRVSGMAVDRSGGAACAQEPRYGTRRLTLPPLEPGVYILRACSLTDTLVVEEVPAGGERRAVLKGKVDRGTGSCGRMRAAAITVGLTALPDSLPSVSLLVWGDVLTEEEVAADTCASAHGSSFDDFYVAVRRFALAPT